MDLRILKLFVLRTLRTTGWVNTLDLWLNNRFGGDPVINRKLHQKCHQIDASFVFHLLCNLLLPLSEVSLVLA